MLRVEKATSERSTGGLSWEHSKDTDVRGIVLAPEVLSLPRTQEARLSADYADKKGVLEV